jgi:hypothetical protein
MPMISVGFVLDQDLTDETYAKSQIRMVRREPPETVMREDNNPGPGAVTLELRSPTRIRRILLTVGFSLLLFPFLTPFVFSLFGFQTSTAAALLPPTPWVLFWEITYIASFFLGLTLLLGLFATWLRGVAHSRMAVSQH